MPQLPYAFALEPHLMKLALANGFTMDLKYRNYLFRKVFERSVSPVSPDVEEKKAARVSYIVSRVRSLCAIDKRHVSQKWLDYR